MTKSVKICLAVVIVIFIASSVAAIFIMRPRSSDEKYVEIVQDNKVLYRIDLSKEENRMFRVEYPEGGWNDITIENSQIFISDADCPDKTCIKTGKLRSDYTPIVCLPHRLVIRFSEQGEQNEN